MVVVVVFGLGMWMGGGGGVGGDGIGMGTGMEIGMVVMGTAMVMDTVIGLVSTGIALRKRTSGDSASIIWKRRIGRRSSSVGHGC